MHVSRQARIRRNLILRARIIQAVRRFFLESGYLEIETPIRIPAPAPEAHIDAQESGTWFLQTSPELCMKQLVASGFDRVFQICKCFRKNERGAVHLPELTMLEWYQAHAGYTDLMTECEKLILQAARTIRPEPSLSFAGHTIDLSRPWPRLSVQGAFQQFSPVPMEQALAEDRFDEMIGIEIEPRLGIDRPVFLYDYPSECAALARCKPNHPNLAERFELYIGGIELCNCFTELTDPIEQRNRFEKELKFRRTSGKTVYPMPEPFLQALQHMPPAAGNALGLDRLVMLLADVQTIDEVIAFTPEELS